MARREVGILVLEIVDMLKQVYTYLLEGKIQVWFGSLGSLSQDHPSVGQLSDKLLENQIYSIFAVEKQQYQWYEVISPTSALTFVTGTIDYILPLINLRVSVQPFICPTHIYLKTTKDPSELVCTFASLLSNIML